MIFLSKIHINFCGPSKILILPSKLPKIGTNIVIWGIKLSFKNHFSCDNKS